jgi:hypothetical protein
VLRSLIWILLNLGIAVAVVFTGFVVVVVTDPTDPGQHVGDLGWTAFFALWLLPWYMPTVVLYGVLLSLLARWIPGRAAALVLAPIAPGYLWAFVFPWLDPVLVSVAVAGTFAYGALVRLPGDRLFSEIVLASAIVLMPLLLFTGAVIVLLPALVVFAVWRFRRQLRTPATVR